jgi:succinyl-CoA synthetase beta subunit
MAMSLLKCAKFGASIALSDKLRVASAGVISQVRWLNLHEFQSKKMMADAGVTVQRFRMADTVDDAVEISKTFKVREFVIKAQILAGGRGKGSFDTGFKGGVHLTKDPQKVAPIVKEMIGHNLITNQTPKSGVKVRQVMVAEALDIERETYLAFLMDRTCNGPVIVGSPMGGMDIEEVAHKNPEAIYKEPVDITVGVTDAQARKMADFLGFKGTKLDDAAEQIKRLYGLFLKVDATQIEINPFGETPDGQVVSFDAKINFDDNAAFRQKAIFAMDDTTESDKREVEAAKHNLNYIGMDGNIGCLVNGAGLAMATMDLIKLHGGEPANFLDVGGGVTEGQVYHAFKILTSDSQVKAILVNVFGGIVNCATIANGIVNAAKSIKMTIPVIVRLEGTNVNAARTILEQSGLAIKTGADFEDAAIKAVASLK